MSLEQALIDACKYVRRELPFGAQNIRGSIYPRANKTVRASRNFAASLEAGAGERLSFAGSVDVYKRFGAGNCEEHASLAYDYLRTTRPSDGVCLVTTADHMFVCTSLFNMVEGVEFNLRGVSDNVRFCDVWLGQWALGQQKLRNSSIRDTDLGGVYERVRFCQLVSLTGENPERATVVKIGRANN
jgi:hypothetical protein